jgi:hypothetical protein
MRIVVRHDNDDRWWWTAVDEAGATLALSVPFGSRSDCARAIAELKVEGPAATVTYDGQAAPTPLSAAHGRSRA